MSLRLPLFMIVRVQSSAGRRGLRLWLPLLLILILLLPFLLVLLPVYFVACAILSLRPFKMLSAFFAVLGSLGGTHVEVDRPGTSVFLHIY
jgi:hypothetical protein